MWYEFEYNKPYHHMNMQERLRFEHEPDYFEIEEDNFNIDEYLEDFECDAEGTP